MASSADAIISKVLRRGGTITVSRRSIVVDDDHIYPIDNIAHIGSGDIDKFKIPWLLIAALAIIWNPIALIALVLEVTVSGLPIFSVLFGLFGFSIYGGATVWNLKKPKYRGLLLVLNSGHWFLFETRDIEGLRRVARDVFAIVERPELLEAGHHFEINVDQSSIGGSIVLGDIAGDLISATHTMQAQQSAATPPPPRRGREGFPPPPSAEWSS